MTSEDGVLRQCPERAAVLDRCRRHRPGAAGLAGAGYRTDQMELERRTSLAGALGAAGDRTDWDRRAQDRTAGARQAVPTGAVGGVDLVAVADCSKDRLQRKGRDVLQVLAARRHTHRADRMPGCRNCRKARQELIEGHTRLQRKGVQGCVLFEHAVPAEAPSCTLVLPHSHRAARHCLVDNTTSFLCTVLIGSDGGRASTKRDGRSEGPLFCGALEAYTISGRVLGTYCVAHRRSCRQSKTGAMQQETKAAVDEHRSRRHRLILSSYFLFCCEGVRRSSTQLLRITCYFRNHTCIALNPPPTSLNFADPAEKDASFDRFCHGYNRRATQVFITVKISTNNTVTSHLGDVVAIAFIVAFAVASTKRDRAASAALVTAVRRARRFRVGLDDQVGGSIGRERPSGRLQSRVCELSVRFASQHVYR